MTKTDIIKVRFLKGELPFGREYSYLTPEVVKIGDLVEMETKSGVAKGVVAQTNIPESEIAAFKDKMKSIIGKYEEPEKETCPRCGQALETERNKKALSRRGNFYVCSSCGTQEAIEDAIEGGVGNEK